MKKIILPVLTIFATCSLFAQQDPKAEPILDKVADVMQSYSTVKMNFVYEMESLADKSNFSQTGKLYLKGEKYKIKLQDSEIMFDGTKLYNYIPEAEEVTVTMPEESYDEFFLNNPSKIFTLYREDFKYLYVGDEVYDDTDCYQVDLFPMNLDRTYSRVKLWIDKKNYHLLQAKVIGKGGDRYTVSFSNYKANEAMSDDFFMFNAKANPSVEVIDMTDF